MFFSAGPTEVVKLNIEPFINGSMDSIILLADFLNIGIKLKLTIRFPFDIMC